MSFEDPNIDPAAGDGAADPGTQPAAPAAPAERTYTKQEYDALRVNVGRSYEENARRREAALRAEFEQRYVPREQPKPSDPWEEFDPRAKAALEKVLEARLAPFQQFQAQAKERQEDSDFRNEEVEARTKYPDYAPNRDAILKFGMSHGIATAEGAYHAWRSATQWRDPVKADQEAVAKYLKKKTAQAVQTPASESRGGAAPSSQQKFKNREEMDEAVLEMIHASDNT